MSRPQGRMSDQMRPIEILPGISPYAEGSCLIRVGNTHVHCTASVEDKVPPFLKGQGKGWLTAEYAMLPRSTHTRSNRDTGKQSGRSVEIQRLIGRSLRSVVDLKTLGERTITLDCDVLQADGGTRTAAITGAFVALQQAIQWMQQTERITESPVQQWLAAVSVGVVEDAELLDLEYAEDSTAEVDMNLVMTDTGKFIEVQGTAEGLPFDRDRLNRLLDLGAGGILTQIAKQQEALKLFQTSQHILPIHN